MLGARVFEADIGILPGDPLRIPQPAASHNWSGNEASEIDRGAKSQTIGNETSSGEAGASPPPRTCDFEDLALDRHGGGNDGRCRCVRPPIRSKARTGTSACVGQGALPPREGFSARRV